MNTRQVYWFVLAIVLSAWFVKSSPVKQNLADSSPNDELAIAKIVNEPSSLSITKDQWVVGGKCNIEYLNDAPMSNAVHNFDRNNTLRLLGWAMDIESARLPDSLFIRFEGEHNADYFARANIGLVRADVRDYFGVGEFLIRSGFKTNIDFGDLPDGEYSLNLIMKFVDAIYLCDNGRKILVQ
ncbi:MAG: hypothetical protein ACRESZ_23035 [Methylococcales bacterium]